MRRIPASGLHWSTVPALGTIGTSGVDITAEQLAPHADLADVVERFWAIRWSAQYPDENADPCAGPAFDPESDRHVVSLPFPEPLVVLLPGKRMIYHGIVRKRRRVSLGLCGTVYGAAFRPGVAPAFIGGSAREHTDRIFELAETDWGLRAHRLGGDLRAATQEGLPAVAAAFERHLRGALPLHDDPDRVRVGEMVDAIRHGGLTRVTELSERFHLSARTIQRGFGRQLGVSPKYLLRRYRVHQAAHRLQHDPPERWSQLAAELGYFDDSHFARDFADTLGVTPYAFVQGAAAHPARQAAEPRPVRAA